MEAAKGLLANEGRSVTETAMHLGFSSSQFFATVFKRFTQQTPVEFCTKGPITPLRPGLVQPSLGPPGLGQRFGQARRVPARPRV